MCDRLPLAGVADRLGGSVHLVRSWLREDGFTIRPGGRHGSPRPAKPIKPAPPAAELRALHEQRLGRQGLARH